MTERGSELVRLMSTYAPQSFPASHSVATAGIIGPDVIRMYDELETYEPELEGIAKWRSPRYEIPAFANVVRPLFDPTRFAVGIYAWRDGASYLSQDILLGSSGDGLLTYFSGDWDGRPPSAVWDDVLHLGELAAATGDFGARRVGDKVYLTDHRIVNPDPSMFEPAAWEEIDAARARAQRFTRPRRR